MGPLISESRGRRTSDEEGEVRVSFVSFSFPRTQKLLFDPLSLPRGHSIRIYALYVPWVHNRLNRVEKSTAHLKDVLGILLRCHSHLKR